MLLSFLYKKKSTPRPDSMFNRQSAGYKISPLPRRYSVCSPPRQKGGIFNSATPLVCSGMVHSPTCMALHVPTQPRAASLQNKKPRGTWRANVAHAQKKERVAYINHVRFPFERCCLRGESTFKIREAFLFPTPKSLGGFAFVLCSGLFCIFI